METTDWKIAQFRLTRLPRVYPVYPFTQNLFGNQSTKLIDDSQIGVEGIANSEANTDAVMEKCFH